MTIEQQRSNDGKEDLNSKSLKIIRNIRFTDREIDIIACLLGGRSYKKIASILVISPKTVELHVRNIMLRLGCNSREGIIDFIEKSDKFTLVKTHYSSILIKMIFEQELKKLSPITKGSNFDCLIFHYEKPITKASFVYQLEQSLNITGIKTFSKTWSQDKSRGFLSNKIGAKQVSTIIYVLSRTFIEQLKTLRYDIFQEASDLITLVKESACPIIFLLPDDKISFDIDKSQSNFSYISLVETGNYYFLVFELLKKILISKDITTYITAFKGQYEILQGHSASQRWSKNDELITKIGSAENNNQKNNKIHFNWLMIFIILFFSFSFILFKITNKENSYISSKIQGIKTKFTDNKQNKLLENQNKTAIFNLPTRNNKFVGRKYYLSHIKTQLDRQKIGIITQAISGLGGVGKTQLASEFAYQAAERSDYKIILWISAETNDAINGIYKELAEYLKIDVKGFNPNKIQALVHGELTKKYQGGKVLFILDNVPNYSDIQDYTSRLYKQLATNCTLHILITSRSQYWPEGKPTIIDTFTPDEAVTFIKKHLPDENENSILKLAETLHYFPLALSQAVAYIKAHTNIDDYLELYATKQKDYLDKFPGDRDQYAESLWKTWNIALAKLSTSAKEMLYISSYLYPDNIPFVFFDDLTVEERAGAIEDLRKHSFIIITSDNKSFKIHRLLQDVIRTSIALNGENSFFTGKFDYLTKAINLLKDKFDFSYAKQNKWGLCGQYLTHAQYLAEHEINTGNKFVHTGMQLYSQVSMYTMYVQHDDKNAKKMWEKLATLVKQYYGNDKSYELVLANINTHLGRAIRQIGDLNQARECLEKVLLAYKSKISTVSINIEKLLSCLRWDKNLTSYDGIKCDQGFVFLTLGDINEQTLINHKAAKDYYEKALKMLNECKQTNFIMLYQVALLVALSDATYYEDLGRAFEIINSAKVIVDKNFPGHLKQATVYKRIALLQYYMGKYDEAKESIEKSLKIRLAILSKDHYKTGASRSLLGLILCASNHLNESIMQLKQAEEIYEKNYPEGHYRFIPLYTNLSYAYERNREYEKALLYLIKAQKIAIKTRKVYALYLYKISPVEKLPVFLETKNISYYTQALGLIRKIYGEDHVRVAYYHYLLGLAFKNIGDDYKARQHYQKSIEIMSKQHFTDKILDMENQKNVKVIQQHLQGLM